MTATVAILGTRYPDFSIEQEILGPRSSIVSANGADADEVIETASAAAVIIAGSRPKFTASVIQRLPQCRGIVRSGIGLDSVDLEAARQAGMWVAYVPDYGTEAVAQHTLALALAGSRRLREADAITKSGEWGFDELRPLHLPHTQTAAVVGFGRIGARVAELFRGVGFGRILAHDPHRTPGGDGIEAVDLATLLAEADVVSLHAPTPPDGAPLIDPHTIGAMKPGSVLVNTSRGALIDMTALAAGLAAGAPRVAALDVFQPEPPDLRALDGVSHRLILSPHMAWYSEESQQELRRKSAPEARRILDGQRPANPVVYPEDLS